jgi:hypothetical protein
VAKSPASSVSAYTQFVFDLLGRRRYGLEDACVCFFTGRLTSVHIVGMISRLDVVVIVDKG